MQKPNFPGPGSGMVPPRGIASPAHRDVRSPFCANWKQLPNFVRGIESSVHARFMEESLVSGAYLGRGERLRGDACFWAWRMECGREALFGGGLSRSSLLGFQRERFLMNEVILLPTSKRNTPQT
jgi:hypothetical protein